MQEQHENRIKKIIEKFGKEKQSIVCIEEFAEVIQAVIKIQRKGLTEETKEHLTEEIADALICISQLKIMYGITEEDLNKYFEYKITRTEERSGINESN